MLPINQLLNQGRYRVIQSLGQNGVGLLYEAFDNVLQSNVVLKEIAVKLGKISTVSQQESLKLAFADEAKSLKAINHESFLQIHDYFSEIDRHYLVMEANAAGNLQELLKKKGRAFSPSEIVRWAEQLLDALGYLHSQMPPIIHRDIKPHNLKLTADGKIKLSPPGISKQLIEKINKTDAHHSSAATNLHFLPLEQIWEGLDTASQKVITNSYNEKSEEILKQPTDSASDIYSLGATLYYLLTAQLPIDALERSIDILEGKADPLRSPNQLNPSIPLEISNILMKSLEVKRENRFSLPSIMRQVLKTAVLQIKEREAAESQAKDDREEAEALQDLRMAEQKRLDLDRQLIEQKALEIEAEQKRLEMERELVNQRKSELEAASKRQEELRLQQQREAEAKKQREAEAKLKAEKAAVEAQALMFDVDILELEIEKSFPPVAKNEEIIAPVISANVITTNVNSNSFADSSSSAETSILFAESQKSDGGFWKIPAIAVAVLAFGGAGFGIWYSQQTSAGNPNQTVPTQTVSTIEPAKPAANNENAPTAPTAEKPLETTNVPVNAPLTDVIQTPANPVTAKTKPTTTPTPKPKKQATPPPQTAENQKKPVTVDDIINDN